MDKITVGIPTFNRPEGLSRTLTQISGQTFKNLEIIVSDNASTDPMVAHVLRDWGKKDPRIRVIQQAHNIGIINNFIEVLSHSTSDFFMWAADDDEWHPEFIDNCYNALINNNVGSVMTGFTRDFRSENQKHPALLPKLDGVDRFRDVMHFFDTMPHSIFYGLHRKETIIYLLNARSDRWLFDDEYVLIKQILSNGFLTLPEVSLYTAGVDEFPYKIKLPKESDSHQFYYYKRIVHFINLISEVETLTDQQKIIVLQRYILQKLSTLLNFEKEIRPSEQYELASMLYSFISKIDISKIHGYIKLLDAVNSLK
jgi:glycosyltransferase involved in cell wall biosynthesis